MTSDQILEFLLVAGAAYAMFKAGIAYAIWKIQQDLIALENGELELDDSPEDDDPMANAEFMNITKQDGIFYAYGRDNRFLTQADSLKSLFSDIKDKYPHTIWLIGNDHKSLSKEEQESIIPTLKSIFKESKEND